MIVKVFYQKNLSRMTATFHLKDSIKISFDKGILELPHITYKNVEKVEMQDDSDRFWRV